MVLKRKQSRARAFIVFSDLCDELAAIDSFGHELTLNRPPVHTKRNRHTGCWHELKPYLIIFFLSHSVNTYCKLFSSIHRRRSKAKCVIQSVSRWPLSCLLSNQIDTCPFPFICSDIQHLLSLASRRWFALISQWTSLCHLTVFNG